MKRMSRSGVIAGATVLALAAGGGVAYAYWTSNGTGTGTAAAGSTAKVTFAQTGTITGLYPNGPAQDVIVKIANPDVSDVTLSTVGAAVQDTSDGGCTASDFKVVDAGWNGVIPGSGSKTATIATIQMIDTGLDQNSCKGATVNLVFNAS